MRTTEERRLLLSGALALGFWFLILALSAFIPAGLPAGGARFSELTVLISDAAETGNRIAALRSEPVAEPTLAARTSDNAAVPQKEAAEPVPENPQPAAAPTETPISEIDGPAIPSGSAATGLGEASTQAEGIPAAGAIAKNPGDASASAVGNGVGEPSADAMAILNAGIKKNLRYPPQARKRGIQGKVLIDLEVGTGGSLKDIRVSASSGSAILDDAALRLLKGLFPLSGSQASAFRTKIAIEYRLD